MSERQALSETVRVYANWYAGGGGNRPTQHHSLVYSTMPEIRARGVETFLDIGCGRGFVLRSLIHQHGLLGTGTEIVAALLQSDLKHLAVYPYPVGGLGAFDDGEFDLCLMLQLLDHLRDEAEVDECLSHAVRLSRTGIMVTVGGPPTGMETVTRDLDWWLGHIGIVTGHAPEVSRARDGARLFTCWWADREARA